MNWNEYINLYPDRYMMETEFDAKKHQFIEILSFLNKRRPISILDIGGGVNGSISNDQRSNHCYLLDPYVKGLPDGYKGTVDWNANFIRYDAIICRGAFNYLSEKEIKKIPELLGYKGLFLFNTFGKPSQIMRSYNKNNQLAGFEETRYIKKDNIIRHKLMPADKCTIIEHDIIYYSPEKIQELFNKKIITKERVGKNSDYYIIQNP